MPLFNHKILQKHLPKTTGIPAEHREIIEAWVSQIQSGKLAKQNEIEVQAPFTQQIMCKLLGYTALAEKEQYTVAREYPVARGKVDLAIGNFCGDKQKDIVLAPFELKGASTKNLDAIMAGRHKTPVQQAFEYAKDIKGAKWVLLSNFIELRLYAISETSLVYETFLLEDLLIPEKYYKFQLLLNAENLITGKTEALLVESDNADKDISTKLYQDYKLLRENMLSHLIEDNPNCSPANLIRPTQKLLDRVLFISFAEDKGLLPDTSIKKAFEHNDPYNPKPIYQNFIGLFNSVDKGNRALNIPAYNGGLFASDDELNSLNVSNQLCEGFKDLAEYDFDSEVSVTILGHIFEQSIADLEVLTETIASGELPKPKTKSTSVSGKRKQHGVVYTPDNITQFIVQNTLGTYIEEKFLELFSKYGKYKADGTIQWKKGRKTEQRFWFSWQETLKTIKVVDPACGSGAFLIAAFDYLYSEYQKSNDKIAELTGQHSVLDLNKEILNYNLFGVDINEESIEITKLSLWLKTAERGKPLESLDANFITGNSLSFDSALPSTKFTWKETFKDIFDEGGFDIVLGNPPYVRQELLSDIKPWLEANYSVYHGVLDLYGYFFELGAKLLKLNGRMAYISSSTFIKTSSGKSLRSFLSKELTLEKIINFGDLQIFEGVTTYPIIIILEKRPFTKKNEIEIMVLQNKLPENLQVSFEQEKGVMKQSHLGAESWQLEDEQLHKLRNKLYRDTSTLKEVYGSPYYGIKTGLNNAFVISEETKTDIVNKDAQADEVLRPFLEGKDLKKWHSQSRNKWLITMPKYWTREKMGKAQSTPLSEEDAWAWLVTSFPKLSEWLLPFQLKAKKRCDKGEFWWELRACAYYNEFEKPKIQYGHFSPEPLFHYNTNNAYSNDKSYIIPTSDLFLYGLLNSKIYWFLMKSMCPFVRGGFYEVRTQYIEKLPIPEKPENELISILANDTQIKTESRYQCELKFRRRLADLCPENQSFKINNKLNKWWELDFSELQKEIKKTFNGTIPVAERNDWQDYFDTEKNNRDTLNIEIAKLEIQLNNEVYSLFDLTSEEVQLLEQEI